MAGQAIGFVEGLVVVRLLQVRTLRVVAVQAKGRRRLGQMEIKFDLADLAGLVGDVASVATHVKRSVSTAFRRNVCTLVMAGEAEVVLLIARGRLQQLELVIGGVGIVAFEAVPDRRRSVETFYVGCFLVGMAGQTKSIGSGGDQLDAGDVLVDPNL